MNYVVTYWVPPDTSEARKKALCMYFDLQRKTKERFGCHQTIVTNVDYPHAVPLVLPPGFLPRHGILAKWFGLGQMIDSGMRCPIMMHDHDVFIRAPIAYDMEAMYSAYARDGYVSDQIIIIPPMRKNDVMNYINRLRSFTFQGGFRNGYGCEIRHEGRYSSEIVQVKMQPRPFANTPAKPTITLQDVVSFDIQDTHSLDRGTADCPPISDEVQAVHAHLNRGEVTASLMEWLNRAHECGNMMPAEKD